MFNLNNLLNLFSSVKRTEQNDNSKKVEIITINSTNAYVTADMHEHHATLLQELQQNVCLIIFVVVALLVVIFGVGSYIMMRKYRKKTRVEEEARLKKLVELWTNQATAALPPPPQDY